MTVRAFNHIVAVLLVACLSAQTATASYEFRAMSNESKICSGVLCHQLITRNSALETAFEEQALLLPVVSGIGYLGGRGRNIVCHGAARIREDITAWHGQTPGDFFSGFLSGVFGLGPPSAGLESDPRSAQTEKDQEMVDVVDENDNVTGRISRDDAHKTGARHRTITVLLVDLRNCTVAFQRRALNKTTFANRWDVSVAGHVKAGSHYAPTSHEELREEAPIEIDPFRFIQVEKEGFFEADYQDSAIGHDRESKTVYIVPLTPTEVDQVMARNAELEEFWQGYPPQPGGKFTSRQEELVMQKACQLANKPLEELDPQARQKYAADAEAYFEVAGYRFLTLDAAVAEYEQAPLHFAGGFYSLFGSSYPNGVPNPNVTRYTEILRDAMRDAVYIVDLPKEVISLTCSFTSFVALEDWMNQVVMAIGAGETPSGRLLSVIETMAYLFGLESKPDKGIIDSVASIAKNLQLTKREREHVWEVFYNPVRYEYGQGWEDVEAYVLRLLGQVRESNSPFNILSRIKQYKSILLKLGKVISQIEGSTSEEPALRPDEIIEKALEHWQTIAANPITNFDDILGFNFVIDDANLDDAGRDAALTDYSSQTEALFRQNANLRVTTIRKEGRVPGYESVNLFVQGLRNHRQFGALPIKVQFRFKSVLFGESAMYYPYKRYGIWTLPPWARNIAINPAAPFRHLQEALFAAFQQFVSRVPIKHFDITEHMAPRSGWPFLIAAGDPQYRHSKEGSDPTEQNPPPAIVPPNVGPIPPASGPIGTSLTTTLWMSAALVLLGILGTALFAFADPSCGVSSHAAVNLTGIDFASLLGGLLHHPGAFAAGLIGAEAISGAAGFPLLIAGERALQPYLPAARSKIIEDQGVIRQYESGALMIPPHARPKLEEHGTQQYRGDACPRLNQQDFGSCALATAMNALRVFDLLPPGLTEDALLGGLADQDFEYLPFFQVFGLAGHAIPRIIRQWGGEVSGEMDPAHDSVGKLIDALLRGHVAIVSINAHLVLLSGLERLADGHLGVRIHDPWKTPYETAPLSEYFAGIVHQQFSALEKGEKHIGWCWLIGKGSSANAQGGTATRPAGDYELVLPSHHRLGRAA
jgi:isopentenyldiphosphate isomerase